MIIHDSILRGYFPLLYKLVKPGKEVYIHKSGDVYYLAKYVPSRDFETADKARVNFVKCVWKYRNGDSKARERISDLYLRYVEEFIKRKKISGDVLLTCIPRATKEKKNPLANTIYHIYVYGKTGEAQLHNGFGYIKRRKALSPIHQGNRYSKEALKESLVIRDERRFDMVILLDDIVNTGNTFAAAKELLIEHGNGRVYCLSLFVTH